MATDWITTNEACKLSGYHSVHMRRLLLAGKVKGQKWGRDWQVSRASLFAHIRQVKKLGRKRGPKRRS